MMQREASSAERKAAGSWAWNMFGRFIEEATDERELTQTRQSPPVGMKERTNFSKGYGNA
jgi:hypothetical protein